MKKKRRMEKNESRYRYDTMVLSGGAMRGFGLLGAIQYLQDRHWLGGIKKYIGTSIGAIISYLICIGYTPTEIMVAMCRKEFFEKIANIDVMNIMNGTGAVSFLLIQEQLEKMTVQKIKKYITLSELYTVYGKELICCTYNKTLCKPEYISHENHPNMSCITALRMTSSLPFLFDAFHYEGYVYIDGVVADNFPLSQATITDRVIGIHLENKATGDHEDQNVLSDLYSTLVIPITQMEKLMIRHACAQNPEMDIVSIPIPTETALLLNVSTKSKFDMFSIGYESIKSHLHDDE